MKPGKIDFMDYGAAGRTKLREVCCRLIIFRSAVDAYGGHFPTAEAAAAAARIYEIYEQINDVLSAADADMDRIGAAIFGGPYWAEEANE